MPMRNVIRSTSWSRNARHRQAALRSRYGRAPSSAWTTHLAWTEGAGPEIRDPFRGTVRLGLAGRDLEFAVDDAAGGPHDAPTPGELLCAALAASVDSTLRLVAARMNITVEHLVVLVTGDVDARGPLGDAAVTSAFQSMRLEIQLEVAPGPAARDIAALLDSAERQCTVLQTLRSSVGIEVIHPEAIAGTPLAAAADGRR